MSVNLQEQIIARLRVKPVIDVNEEIRKRVGFLKEQLLNAGASGVTVAISGGLDSAVVAGLCKLAADELTKEQGKEYMALGVFQPYGEQEDIQDSYAVAKALGLTSTVETNIESTVDEITLEAEYALKSLGVHKHLSRSGKGNVKARSRMIMMYALAFELNLLVAGTDHASEILTGFFTKWGDGAVDVMPLSSLNKRQVAQVAAKLGVPQQVIDKVPTAGLWPGQTDEAELGLSYDEINDFLEGKDINPDARQKLENHYKRTEHKRSPIPGI